MKLKALVGVAFVAVLVVGARQADAALITTYYGDDDGFGIGATSGSIDPTMSNAGLGEAPGTDVRLIGDGFIAPAFRPVGGFSPFVIPGGDVIVSATLTMRAGAWDTNPSPVGVGANQILLDGLAVPSAFFGLFNANNGNSGVLVETYSLALGPAFLTLLGDGAVSLLGTNLTERSGSGSFQIDFLQLDITTEAVPEPGTMGLLGMGMALLGAARARRRR